MTTYNQDKRALYDRWQKPGIMLNIRKSLQRLVIMKLPRWLPLCFRKENTLSGESISLAYSGNGWKSVLKNMTIRANMNDVFRCSTIKGKSGVLSILRTTVSFLWTWHFKPRVKMKSVRKTIIMTILAGGLFFPGLWPLAGCENLNDSMAEDQLLFHGERDTASVERLVFSLASNDLYAENLGGGAIDVLGQRQRYKLSIRRSMNITI